MPDQHHTFKTALAELRTELDLWREAGTVADFWWRDDDAAKPCAGLDRLLELSRSHDVSCGLATIPTQAVPELAQALEDIPCQVLLHGYAHVNHAPKGQGGWEFGNHRDAQTMLRELRQGRDTLAELFGARFVPGFVPPWNKIAPETATLLPLAGLCGLSCTWKKANPEFFGVFRADAHGDVLAWKNKVAFFAGADRVVGELLDHLRFRRESGFVEWAATAADVARTPASHADNLGRVESGDAPLFLGAQGKAQPELRAGRRHKHLLGEPVERQAKVQTGTRDKMLCGVREAAHRGADAPTCVLSHHLEMDEQSWEFMDALLALINDHPASRWLAPSAFWTCGEGA